MSKVVITIEDFDDDNITVSVDKSGVTGEFNESNAPMPLVCAAIMLASVHRAFGAGVTEGNTLQ